MKAGWLFPIYGKIKHVPNHHPVLYLLEQTWKSPIVTVFTSVYQKARFLSNSGCDYQQRLATSSGHWVGTSQTTHVDMLISAQLPFFFWRAGNGNLLVYLKSSRAQLCHGTSAWKCRWATRVGQVASWGPPTRQTSVVAPSCRTLVSSQATSVAACSSSCAALKH
jgi:hypothetical protein